MSCRSFGKIASSPMEPWSVGLTRPLRVATIGRRAPAASDRETCRRSGNGNAPTPQTPRDCRSMSTRIAPRQLSGERKRRVKADRLTPASPTGFRSSIHVTGTACFGASGSRLRLRQAKPCPVQPHQHIRDFKSVWSRPMPKRVRSQEQVAQGPPQPIREPALAQVLGLVVEHVAPLTERFQISRIVVRRIVIEVSAGQNDLCCQDRGATRQFVDWREF